MNVYDSIKNLKENISKDLYIEDGYDNACVDSWVKGMCELFILCADV